jgi:ABC-2 type transport system permease protein
VKKILSVAKWEYIEKVKSKAFLIGLFLTPLIMVGMGVLPTIFATQEDNESRPIGVIDLKGDFTPAFAARLQQRYTLKNGKPNYVVFPIGIGPGTDATAAVKEANARVAAGEFVGYCYIGDPAFGDTVVEYRSPTVGDFMVLGRMEEVLRDIMSERRVAMLGLDAGILKKLKVTLDVRQVKLSKEGEAQKGGFETVFFTAYAFMMMLFFLIVTSGQLLVRSVIEEKSNRIVEVLVSSCSPTELMAGKVLGLSALGLTQMAFWAIAGVALTVNFGIHTIDATQAALLLVYFVLGYLFYASVFIAVGSPLTTEQEAQQVTGYLVMLLILPIVLAFPAMKNPDATWIKVLTLIPFLTPTMMALRIPIQMPPWWEILLTVVIMISAIYGGMVIAGRIFRIGILSTGKSPKLKELVRWVKTG